MATPSVPLLPPGYEMKITPQPWINVKDTLPEWCETVLVYDGLEMFQAAFMPNKREGLPYFYHTERGHLPHVSHWMPLPGKPEVK